MDSAKPAHTILVIDDEPDICEALSMALTLDGYGVRIAHDRDDGLKTAKECSPSVILLDFRIPGCEAEEFLKLLKQSNIVAPVVLMTAGKDPDAKAAELGLKDYLYKPFDLDEMLRLIGRLIGKT